VALGIYIAVAVVWLVPDRRIERVTSAPTDGLVDGSDEES